MDPEPVSVSFVLESNDASVRGEVFVGAERDCGQLTRARWEGGRFDAMGSLRRETHVDLVRVLKTALERIVRFLYCGSLQPIITVSPQKLILQPPFSIFHQKMHESIFHVTSAKLLILSCSFVKDGKETNHHTDESNWAQIIPTLYLDSLMCLASHSVLPKWRCINDVVGSFSSILVEIWYLGWFRAWETITNKFTGRTGCGLNDYI